MYKMKINYNNKVPNEICLNFCLMNIYYKSVNIELFLSEIISKIT